MTSFDVTRRELSLGSQNATTGWYSTSYAETTISMVILRRGQSFSAGRVGFYAIYDYTGFTADTVAIGDQIKDADSVYFTIKTVSAEKWGDQFSHYVCELVKKESYSTGAATSCPTGDQITNGDFETGDLTGWSGDDWSADGAIKHGGSWSAKTSTGASELKQTLNIPVACFDTDLAVTLWYYNSVASGTTEAYAYVEFSNGYRAQIDNLTGILAWTEWTSASAIELDTLLAAGKITLWDRVTAIGVKMIDSPTGTFYLDDISLTPSGSATSSVVWHTGYWGTSTDPRHRQKVLLDTYLDTNNLRKDDGVTSAAYITCFGYPEYPMSLVLNGETKDLIFTASNIQSTPKEEYRHRIYAYDEKVEIVCYAVDKTGITATNLLQQAEQEIRRIATTYPTGSLRSIDTSEPTFTMLGTQKLWHTTVTVNYRISNTSHNPDAPSLGHTHGFTWDGDRLADGPEGDWDLEYNGSTGTITVDEYNNIDMNTTVFVADVDMYNTTNLGLSTTVYNHIRFRFKTSGSATAKMTVIFSDAGTQTIMAETASTSEWTVMDVPLTISKTLDHIVLWCCDNTGHVYWDFVQVHGGEYAPQIYVEARPDYILPNCIKLEIPGYVKTAELEIPAFSGTKTQKMGSKLEVIMTCDMTIDVPCGPGEDVQVDSDGYMIACEWKRPQNDTSKDDEDKLNIFLEILHNQGFNVNYPWTWLKLGDPDMQFKAELVEMRPSLSGEEGMIDLVWREYREGNASNETYQERFNMGQ